MSDALYKFPRLYVAANLNDAPVELSDAQAHYLRNVLRREDGASIRLFNGRDGEHLATLAFTRRAATAQPMQQTRPQPARPRRTHLLFAPLKKDRLDALIECAVQLDATDLHPVLTERTEVREVKEDKLHAHIIEAAEQCERLDLPVLHPMLPLDRALARIDMPVFAGLERSHAVLLTDRLIPAGDCAALVGPVGGWTEREREYLAATTGVTAVSLGPNILRSETAVASFLTRLASDRSL